MISDWLESNIDDHIRYTGNGHEAHFNCIRCDDTRHRMYVSLSTGAVYCHNCGFSGSIVDLIHLIEGVDYNQAHRRATEINGRELTPVSVNDSIMSSMGQVRLLEKRPISLPDEYTLIDTRTRNPRVRCAISYLRSRGVTRRQITEHRMGFCQSGRYNNRVIIPILDHDIPVFWVARAIDRGAYRKEISPSNEDYQISKSEVIFNLDSAVSRYRAVVISEGIFDALSWGEIGISLLGKHLYQAQLDSLLSYHRQIETVYVALDRDARDDEMTLASTLSSYFDDVRCVLIPDGMDDPNSCLCKRGRGYLMRLLDTAEPYSDLSSIHSLLR